MHRKVYMGKCEECDGILWSTDKDSQYLAICYNCDNKIKRRSKVLLFFVFILYCLALYGFLYIVGKSIWG